MSSESERVRSPSMRDVAQLAGVSGQTVSRVANRMGNVAQATHDRVEQAMAELGYRPNFAARALRSGEFRSIAVVSFDTQSLGNVRTIAAIAAEAARRSYAIEFIQIQSTDTLPDARDFSWAMRRLGQEAVDGIILILETTVATEAALRMPGRVPVVVVDAAANDRFPSVDANQEQGTRLAVDHLLDLGHPTVWHVAGPSISHAAAARRRAWQSRLVERGRHVPPMIRGDWTPESGYHAGLLLAEQHHVSAVFVANDQMALGLLRAFHEKCVDVPTEVSVVGFDDMAESGSFWPPLTTVRQQFSLAGVTAVGLLVDAIEGDHVSPGRRVVDTELVVRGSTGTWSPPRP